MLRSLTGLLTPPEPGPGEVDNGGISPPLFSSSFLSFRSSYIGNLLQDQDLRPPSPFLRIYLYCHESTSQGLEGKVDLSLCDDLMLKKERRF